MFSTVLYIIVAYYLYKNIDTRLQTASRETLSILNEYYAVGGSKTGSLEFAVKKTMFYHADYPISLFDYGRMKRVETRWQERADALGLNNNYIVFVFADKQRLLRTMNVPSRLAPYFVERAKNINKKKRSSIFYNLTFEKHVLRFIAVPYEDVHGRINVLQIGISQKPVEQLLMTLVRAFLTGIPLLLIFTSFVGRIFVKRVLDPIEEIAATASQITNKDLSLRVKSEHLDEEIEYLVASFNNMITRLEKSFEHINEFSSRVAHELKTPIAIIKGESELILSKPRSEKEYIDALRINLEEADRMRKTVEDLLLLARLEYQVGVFKFQSIDFREFFVEICEQSKILASKKNLVVKEEILCGKVIINADKLHLRRVFFNIIDNAIKFTFSPGEIHLKAKCDADKVVIFISDTGVGIPETNLPLVFDKFYHVDHSGKNEGQSSGLGLSIVQSIVKIHQGQIRVTSEINKGTTFIIMLPIDVAALESMNKF